MVERKRTATSRGATPAHDLNGIHDPSEAPRETLNGESQPPAYPTYTDDGNWEDEPDHTLAYPRERSPAPSGALRAARRRKAATGRKAYAPPSSSLKKTFVPKAKETRENVPPLVNIDRHQVARGVFGGVAFTSNYLIGVLRTALMLSKYPLGVFLFIYLLLFALGRVQSELRKVFAPVCWIPGIASTPMCYVPPPSVVPKRAEYAELSNLESSTFEKLLDNAAGGTSLSLDIKKAEMATSDLIVLVAHSELKGRDTLAQHLRQFVDAAKMAGRGLSRLNSRVNGAVDSIIALNDHTLRTIEAAAKKEEASLRIFRPFSNGVATQRVAAEMFGDSMEVLASHMKRIMVEADVSMKHLDRLEEMLVTLHEIVTRENKTVVAEKEEVLAQLWTWLGGNRRELKSADFNLHLLLHIGQYRMRAAAHVAATLSALATMSDGMEDLRERVTAPELLGDKVPVDVHLKGIQAGLDRLTATRKSAQLQEENVFRNLLGDGSMFEGKLEIDM